MKNTELRIGNAVMQPDGTVSYVTGMTNGGAVWLVQNPSSFCCAFSISQINPIPITEDWLVKLGMVKYEGWDGTIFWRRNEDEMTHERFELMETIHGYEAPSGKIIESVHILQNAYYFHTLTGEELTTI